MVNNMIWKQPEDRQLIKKIFSQEKMTPEEEIKKIIDAKNGNLIAKNEVIVAYLKLATTHANKYKNYGLPYADLFQSACIGICRAINGFKPEIGAHFSSYADKWIRSEIYEFITNNWGIVKISTKNRKKLFFKMFKLSKNAEKILYDNELTNISHTEIINQIHKDNPEFTLCEIEEMYNIMNFKPKSINTFKYHDDEEEFGDSIIDNSPNQYDILEEKNTKSTIKHEITNILEKMREKHPRWAEIIYHRHLSKNQLTLDKLSQQYSVSREAIRKQEYKAFNFIHDLMKDKIDMLI